jgi:hypothetical protein
MSDAAQCSAHGPKERFCLLVHDQMRTFDFAGYLFRRKVAKLGQNDTGVHELDAYEVSPSA